ncbi:hypothetical protein F2Q69_00037087 [Brassica cretica]|uniref:PUM-HD domain-containing protein n=1 Tax=Brassica cretica TaxID=69181 RepID=A0A8S9SQ83_BRACR|nr:hypothetical protein F2Q69_00037087 [Brassica cretica]
MVILCPVLKDRLLYLLEKLFLQILMFGGLITPLLSHLIHHFTTHELQLLIPMTSENLHHVSYDHTGYNNVLQLLKQSSTEFLFSLVSNLDHEKLDRLFRFTNGSSLLQFLVSSHVAELVLEKLYNRFLTLSMHKYCSFLVSHCLEHCHYIICLKIIEELTPGFSHYKKTRRIPTEVPTDINVVGLSYLILHPHANFALQAIIKRQWKSGLQLHPLIQRRTKSRLHELMLSPVGKQGELVSVRIEYADALLECSAPDVRSQILASEVNSLED